MPHLHHPHLHQKIYRLISDGLPYRHRRCHHSWNQRPPTLRHHYNHRYRHMTLLSSVALDLAGVVDDSFYRGCRISDH